MSYLFTVNLPIRAHLLKMIAYNRDTTPYILNQSKDIYSEIIYGNLTRRKVLLDEKILIRYSEKLTIVIPDELLLSKKFDFDKKRITRIDQLLSGLFEEKLFSYLEDNCFEKYDIDKFLQKFMQKYKLVDEDIHLDSLRKKYSRYRKKRPDKSFPNFRKRHSTSPTNEQSRMFY